MRMINNIYFIITKITFFFSSCFNIQKNITICIFNITKNTYFTIIINFYFMFINVFLLILKILYIFFKFNHIIPHHTEQHHTPQNNTPPYRTIIYLNSLMFFIIFIPHSFILFIDSMGSPIGLVADIFTYTSNPACANCIAVVETQ